jgi:predicted nuclease of predicted toxin-antitoxin system
LKQPLLDAGHDIEWTGDWPEDPGDREILDKAREQGRILVTLDKDFGELAVVRRIPHGGILRLVALSTRQQVAVCLAALRRYEQELEAGAIVTAEAGRIRIRPVEE